MDKHPVNNILNSQKDLFSKDLSDNAKMQHLHILRRYYYFNKNNNNSRVLYPIIRNNDKNMKLAYELFTDDNKKIAMNIINSDAFLNEIKSEQILKDIENSTIVKVYYPVSDNETSSRIDETKNEIDEIKINREINEIIVEIEKKLKTDILEFLESKDNLFWEYMNKKHTTFLYNGMSNDDITKYLKKRKMSIENYNNEVDEKEKFPTDLPGILHP